MHAVHRVSAPILSALRSPEQLSVPSIPSIPGLDLLDDSTKSGRDLCIKTWRQVS
jgi:hypothetical protein